MLSGLLQTRLADLGCDGPQFYKKMDCALSYVRNKKGYFNYSHNAS